MIPNSKAPVLPLVIQPGFAGSRNLTDPPTSSKHALKELIDKSWIAGHANHMIRFSDKRLLGLYPDVVPAKP